MATVPWHTALGLTGTADPLPALQQSPPGGFAFQDPMQGMGFFDRMAYLRENNPQILGNLAAGFISGDPAAGIAKSTQAMGDLRNQEIDKQYKNTVSNQTYQWLLSQGYSEADAKAGMMNPEILNSMLKGKESSLINAGDGNLYDPTTGEWIQAPGAGNAKAPTIVELYDEAGQPYKAQWNASTGTYDRLGGSKAPAQKAPTEQVVRNRQIYNVVKPELDALLGDGVTPGTYDSLTGGRDQAGNLIAGGVKAITGVDPSAFVTSPQYQQAKDSVKSIYASYIYSVSGAAASEHEVERQASILMPVPGEDPQQTAAKKTRIKTMVDSIRSVAESSGMPSSATPADKPISEMTDAELEEAAR